MSESENKRALLMEGVLHIGNDASEAQISTTSSVLFGYDADNPLVVDVIAHGDIFDIIHAFSLDRDLLFSMFDSEEPVGIDTPTILTKHSAYVSIERIAGDPYVRIDVPLRSLIKMSQIIKQMVPDPQEAIQRQMDTWLDNL